jgi:predicted glycoside hydrolase/deacetylase ChbG (UPF0249 family)
MKQRCLIVNADDFGLSTSVNSGIAAAHERGIVTAATLMVRGLAARQAAAYAWTRPQLSVGLHVDLAEWEYRDGQWVARYEVVDAEDHAAVLREVDRQLEVFRQLLGRNPAHLDSHQHMHRSEPVAGIVRDLGRRLDIPVRQQTSSIAYRGDFYGQTGKGEPYPQAITVEALLRVFDTLPAGYTELSCHPGAPDPDLNTAYRDERAVEVSVLCDSRVRDGLVARRIDLVSFHDVPRVSRC